MHGVGRLDEVAALAHDLLREGRLLGLHAAEIRDDFWQAERVNGFALVEEGTGSDKAKFEERNRDSGDAEEEVATERRRE